MNKWKRWLWAGVCALGLAITLGTNGTEAQAPTPIGGGLYVGDKPLLGAGKEAWDVYGVLHLPDGSLLTWGFCDALTKEQPYLKKSSDAGGSWQDVKMPGPSDAYRYWVEGNRLYAWSAKQGLWLSRDGANTWKSVWKGGGKTTSVDVQGEKIAAVTDGVVQVSTDMGKHFKKLESLDGGAVQAAFDSDGTLFAQVHNKVFDFNLNGGGGKWKRVEGAFFSKTGGHVITYDPKGLYLWVKDHTVTYEHPTFKRSAERVLLLGDRMYVVSEGKLYARSLDPNEPWTKSELPNQGFLMDLAPAPGGQLYYAFGTRLPM
jgi:hypothetical protein